MKKITAFLILGFIMILSTLAPSCGSSCGRGDYDGLSKFYTTELFGRVYDNHFEAGKVSDTSVIRFDYLRINLRFTGKYYSNVMNNFSLFPRAYACSPAEPFSEEKVTSITITANKDYDSLHPAGSNLNDIFYVNRSYYGSKYTIEEYLKTIPNVQDLEFSLISAPDIQQEIQFIITYQYDGRLVKVLKYDTPTFIISPI